LTTTQGPEFNTFWPGQELVGQRDSSWPDAKIVKYKGSKYREIESEVGTVIF